MQTNSPKAEAVTESMTEEFPGQRMAEERAKKLKVYRRTYDLAREKHGWQVFLLIWVLSLASIVVGVWTFNLTRSDYQVEHMPHVVFGKNVNLSKLTTWQKVKIVPQLMWFNWGGGIREGRNALMQKIQFDNESAYTMKRTCFLGHEFIVEAK